MATVDISDKTVSQDNRDLLGTLVMLDASVAWDAASIANNAKEAKDITVTGAALGDFVLVSLGVALSNLSLTASVKSTDTVTMILSNNSGGAVDLAATTAYVRVFPRANKLTA